MRTKKCKSQREKKGRDQETTILKTPEEREIEKVEDNKSEYEKRALDEEFHYVGEEDRSTG